jgi:decaprenylphospho-beta-D-ribofuranose 2-oxidase
VRAINAVRAFSEHRSEPSRPVSLYRCFFPFHGREAYFHLFGRSGFHEVQVILPQESLAGYVDLLRDQVKRKRLVIALAATKPFSGKSDLLRFTGGGVGLAFHAPRTLESTVCLAELDRFVVASGGRPNIIKDSRLPRAVVESTYPECDQFRAIRRAWDPHRCFRSELAARLGL